MSDTKPTAPAATPLAPGFLPNLKFDMIAGFLVFLIAMPLCLAIAKASGFPPIAGIWTAVIGGILCSILSNAELTIKGPAAGLIVIVLGAVTDLGKDAIPDATVYSDTVLMKIIPTDLGLETDAQKAEYLEANREKLNGFELKSRRARMGYELALGIGVVSGLVQIGFGLVRAGKLADFFPLTPVHGMLASIGIIIIAKQFYVMVGADAPPDTGPLGLLAGIPSALSMTRLNPEIAIIGIVSLAILIGMSFVRNKVFKRVPGQLVVLIFAILVGMAFHLENKHTYLFPDSFLDMGHEASYEVGPRFLVDMPKVMEEPEDAFCLPRFSAVLTSKGLEYLLLFCLIGSLESLLSAKAVELLDPWKRKTDFNRDLIAIGVANTVATGVGGLPMISEIVRSSANISNGGRTRMANLWHGLFLLAFVLLVPDLIHRIPLAALGAMLVFTGYRLASPKEFVRSYRVGSDQFIVFVGTIIVTLATDLLIGIAFGILLKLLSHLYHGAPLMSMYRTKVNIVLTGDRIATIGVEDSALFSNWLGLKTIILREAEHRDEVRLDLSRTRLIDHSVMEKLHQMEADLKLLDKQLTLLGLENHKSLSSHPLSAKKLSSADVPKLSGVAKVD